MYSAVVLLFCYLVAIMEGKMDYRIVAPEFICDSGRQFATNREDTTTIQLIGNGKIESFKLDFETIGNPCRNTQRCNIIAWKVIRQLEKYLNSYPLTETNSIEFNNTMLLPGFRYILDIYVSHGEDKEETQVALNYVDETYLKSSANALAYITLVGISSTKAHIAYILNAKITICSNIRDFYLRWELLDISQNFIQTFPYRGFELTIQPFTFLGGNSYNIKCDLINSSNSEVITESIHPVTVESENVTLIVKLPMLFTTVKLKQPINIKPFIKDLDNSYTEIKKTWSCIFNNEDVCLNNHDDELYIENGFLNEGEYTISLTLKKGSEIISTSCLVKVSNKVPSIEIDTIETPVLPSSGTKIKAYVEGMKTFCTVQWKSPDGPYFIDLKSIPGNVNQIQHVVARRDLFLEELEEFTSDVVNKEYTLIIPPPNGDRNGLPTLDEDYKLQFLLEVKCPAAQLAENGIDVELSEDFLNDSITVSALVEIEVTVPPKLGPLHVTPEVGIALETVFKYNCDSTTSREATQWFVYKFGYIIGKREFVFSNQLGFGMAESILPYGEYIKTFVTICTTTNFCHIVFGPTVKTSLPTSASEENTMMLLKEFLNTEDFYKAFGYALTIRTIFEDLFVFNDYFCKEVLSKINYFLDIYSNDTENWDTRVNKLITNIKEFRDELLFCEDVLDGLTKLREKLLVQKKENLLVLQRNLLAANKPKITLENFKSYLDVSDLIITSSLDKEKIEAEKQMLENNINNYLASLCSQVYDKQQNVCLEYQHVIVVLEELKKNGYNKVHVVPYADNSWNTTAEIKLETESVEKLGKDKLCLGKVVFRNYFYKPGITYSINIFDSSGEDIIFEPVPTTVLLPLDHSQSVDAIPKCLIYNNGWNNSNCEFIELISKHAQCHCSTLGTYTLDYNKILTTETNDVTGDCTSKATTTPLSQTEQSTRNEEITEKTTQETTMRDNINQNSETTKTNYYTSTISSIASSNTIDNIDDSERGTTTGLQQPGERVTDSLITTNDDFKDNSNNLTPVTSDNGRADASEPITTVISDTTVFDSVNSKESSTVAIEQVTTEISIENSEQSSTALAVTSYADKNEVSQSISEVTAQETSTVPVESGESEETTQDNEELVTSAVTSTVKTSTTVGTEKTDNNLYKNVFQADFNANLFANFSFKFSLNATAGK